MADQWLRHSISGCLPKGRFHLIAVINTSAYLGAAKLSHRLGTDKLTCQYPEWGQLWEMNSAISLLKRTGFSRNAK